MKCIADIFIQHHRAVQLLAAIHRLAKLPFGPQVAWTDHHCATKKQPAKADHLSVACFECENLKFIRISLCS